MKLAPWIAIGCVPALLAGLFIGRCGGPDTSPGPAAGPTRTLPPWRYPEPPSKEVPRTSPAVPTMATIEAGGDQRCPEGGRSRLYLFIGDRLVWDDAADDALRRDGSIEVPVGRHRGERALRLAAAVEEEERATTLEVWPCTGEPVRLETRVIRAHPNRYILVLGRRGVFKLLDMQQDESRPVLKNLAALRLVL